TRRINMQEYAEEVAHIAPEQAWGCELDARSDVYSLGSTFYTLLTGEPAFPGLAGQSMTERQVRDIPSPAIVRPTVPKDIAAIVQRMGAKDPNSRIPTAQDIVSALHAYLPVAQWDSLGLDVTPMPKKKLDARTLTKEKPALKPEKKRGFFARLFGL